MSANTTNDVLDALAAYQHTQRDKIHEIDTGDVSISREALAALGKAARALLSTVKGAGDFEAWPLGDIVKLFASRLYWSEAGGELLMCAQFEGRMVCLPIPSEHWNVNITGQLQ